MRFVVTKSEQQQSGLMLHRSRQLLVCQRTMLSNAIRGHMVELGIISAKGRNGTAELLKIIANEQDDRLIYDDVKLVRDTIQRLGAGTAPPGAVYIGRGSPYGNPFVVGRMLTNTCPAAGTGVGTSRSVMPSGPPTSKSCMACMRSV